MSIIFGVLYLVALLYFVALLIRLALNWVQVFARDWNPRGFAAVFAESVFTITDPPLKAVSRVVPVLRIGPIAINLAFIIVMFAVILLMNLFQLLAQRS